MSCYLNYFRGLAQPGRQELKSIRELTVQNLWKSQPEGEFQGEGKRQVILKGCRSSGMAWGPLIRSPGLGDMRGARQEEGTSLSRSCRQAAHAPWDRTTEGAEAGRRRRPESNQGVVTEVRGCRGHPCLGSRRRPFIHGSPVDTPGQQCCGSSRD